jgi:hypothetical protein
MVGHQTESAPGRITRPEGRGEAAQGLTGMSIPPETPGRPGPNIARLRAAISEERFARYLSSALGDERLAWELYEWGLDVAAAFHVPLHDRPKRRHAAGRSVRLAW